jgi:phosphatidate cytidylyltransferase
VTLTRVLTALVMGPAVLAVVWWGPLWLLAGVVALVAALAMQEFFALGEKLALRGYVLWSGLCAVLLAVVQASQASVDRFAVPGGLSMTRGSEHPFLTVENLLLLFVTGLALAVCANLRPLGDVLGAVATSAAALLLIALPLSYLIRLQGGPQGRVWVLFALWLVWAGDSIAYFVGRALGRWPMAPAISPKKTWEGAAGNLGGSLIVAVIFARWLDAPPTHLLAVAALANIAGQAGDLLESAYKRSAGVKDSGTILPGHGGVLDRIDALIFAAPVVWVYVAFCR